MDVVFVAGVTPIVRDPVAGDAFYRQALGLPLQGEGYLFSEFVEGVKHLGVWPLSQAASSCFGTPEWPHDMPVPQATIEFELGDPDAVAAGVRELEAKGYPIIHEAREEPWGQTVARLYGPEGLLIGLTHTPHLRDGEPA